MSALIFACTANDTDEIEKLLAANADVNATDAATKATPLHAAAAKGNVSVIKLLIRRGAVVDSLDRRGRTPLLVAASFGHLNATRALVLAGADARYVDPSGETPLCKLMSDDIVITTLLLRGSMMNAAASGDASTLVLLLVAAGSDVNRACVNGQTLLERCEQHNLRSVAQILVAAGHHSAKERSAAALDATRAIIKRTRVDFIRAGVFEICVGLQSLELSALELLTIVEVALPTAWLVQDHTKWALICCVRHFLSRKNR